MAQSTDARDLLLDSVSILAAAAEGGRPVDGALDDVLERVRAVVGATQVTVLVADPLTGGLVPHAREGSPAAPGQPGEGAVIVSAHAGGAVVGALALALPPGRTLEPDERDALRAVAQVVALELRNSQLFAGIQERARELDRQVRQLAALTEVARGVALWLDEDDAHRGIVAQARRLVQADAAVLVVSAGEGDAVRAAGEGDAAQAAAAEPQALAAARGGVRRRAARQIAVPLPAAPGNARALGAIAVSRADDRPFTPDDEERLEGLAGQAAVALANARLLADLRREQGERRTLAAALVQAQEQERRRVAENLHDGPVQELAGLGLMLDALASDLGTAAPEAGLDARRAATSARESLRALRRAIVDLHPMALEELGFSAATRTLVERLEWRGVRVVLDLRAADVLTETQRTVAFRIVQEAVANIVRHAEPTTVTIAARVDDDGVVLEVRDDGRGFDPDGGWPGVGAGHLGLAAVKERAALGGGRVSIESAAGRGTTVRLALPVERGSGRTS